MGEAIRSAIGTHYSDSGTPAPSASVGWAVFPEDGEDVEGLIRAADERMLQTTSAGAKIGRCRRRRSRSTGAPGWSAASSRWS